MGIKKLIFWVAGGIASGKSTFCRSLSDYLQNNDIPCHWIEVDLVRRHILYKSQSKKHYEARTALMKSLNLKETHNNFLPADFWQIIFSQKKKMEIYKEIMNPEIIAALKQKMKSLEGIILLEWAMLIEDGMLTLTDNNVMLFDIDANTQLKRLENGWLSEEEVRNRIRFTAWWWFANREKIIIKTQKEKGFWTCLSLKANLTQTEINKAIHFIHSLYDYENSWSV